MSSTASATANAPLLIADDSVLDMLNIVTNVNGQPHGFWQSDVGVSGWLVRVGWLAEPAASRYLPSVLLAVARHLRGVTHVLVETRKANRATSADVLNVFLRRAPSHPVLAWENSTPYVKCLRPTDSVEQCLAPPVETAIHLLAEGDFQPVRVYEHLKCILQFYDHTKSHKRRWCSMIICGNRHKVAEYHKRQQG